MFHHNPKYEKSPNSKPADNRLPAGDHNPAAGKYADIQSTATDPYVKRQAEKDLEYLHKYNFWLSQMSAEELQALKTLGVDKPQISYHGKGGPTLDLADSPAASYEPDFAAIIDGEYENEPALTGNSVEAMRRFVARISASNNVRLELDCFVLVLGLRPYNGQSMTAIAKRHNVTPAAVSKRCVAITKEYGIAPSRAMRSFNAREAAKKAQLKRNRKEEP